MLIGMMPRHARFASAAVMLTVAVTACLSLYGQHDHPPVPEHASGSPLQKALNLLRDGRTDPARAELNRLLAGDSENAEIYYQLARSYLYDSYSGNDPIRARTFLNLAMEALDNALRRNQDHIPTLKAKAMIHARAELLYYDPNKRLSLPLA
jgi:hypothetical protein